MNVLTPKVYSGWGSRDESGHTWIVRFDPDRAARDMTMFLLVRHAMCDPVGRSIAGRLPGIHLNSLGQRQADHLAERLASLTLSGVYSSPLERAMETAGPLGRRHGLDVQPVAGLTEVDFGEWTGKAFEELDQLPAWRRFNEFRSGTSIPGGETMAEVLSRALRELDRLRALHPGSETLVAVVSHGDVLRMLVTHALGVTPDLLHRLELSPASVTILQVEDYGPRLLLLNSTEGWPQEIAAKRSR
jgi:broad specificity phosphatase PhoE